MNFPCDASSSPLSSGMGAFLHKTHYWLAFPGGGTSLQQSVGPETKQSCRRAISCAVRAGSTEEKKSALKYGSFESKFTCWRLRFAGEWKSALSSVCSSSQQSSGATAPTISKAGNIISQDLERLYKKVTIRFDNFLGNFREINLRLCWTSDTRKEQIARWSSDFGRRCWSVHLKECNQHKAPAAFLITHETFWHWEPTKPRPQHAEKRAWAAGAGRIFYQKS